VTPTVVLALLGLIGVGLIVVRRARDRALLLARRFERSGEEYEALSLYWAWGTDADVARIILLLEPGRPLRVRRSDPWLTLTSPANAAAISAIILYQMLRRTGGHRVCLFWPNCSAYGLGVMRRRNVFTASRLVLARVRSCNGAGHGVEILGWL